MPDLEKPVQAVSKAVANLARVGREMVNTTDDTILKQDMPIAITKVENASNLLEEASNLSKGDPYSKIARTKLIEGSRWILQGTSGVLLCFDESEVSIKVPLIFLSLKKCGHKKECKSLSICHYVII